MEDRMDLDDPQLQSWAKSWEEERNDRVNHQLFGRLRPGSDMPMPGWGGIRLVASNDEAGTRTVDIEFRPVVLGKVEFRIELTTQKPGARKPHAKRLFVAARPAALRELAAMLLETAEVAEKNRPRPRPV
jgi:hypothetical protein